MADPVAQRAEVLLGMWGDLATRHVALGAACACGMGGISLRLEDFELDIVDYLEDAGVRSGVPAVVELFTASQTAGYPDQPLRQLLEDLKRGKLSPAVAEWLLPKVERTLRSFAELHGPKAQK
ncbi:MAG: hypothetical protein V4505_06420 [Pseudomonadota bacterium]